MTDNTYRQEAWSLADLFPALGAPQIDEALVALEAQVSTFAGRRPELAPDMASGTFRELLDAYERMIRQLYRIYGFASLSFSGNTQDQQAQSFLARIQQKAAEFSNQTLFFTLWWKALEDEPAERLLAAASDYRYWLEAVRLEKPYTLTEAEEKIINLKDVNGVRALNTLYATITNRYTFELEIDGETKRLTRGELQVYYRDADPDVRAAAYQAIHRVYAADAPVLGQIYQAVVRDWRSENVGVRGFASPLSVRNLANDIADEVVETLLSVCRDNAPLFHRYFQLKAQWLGLDKLRRYDVYAPVAKSERHYPYGTAVSMVLESFEVYAPEFAALARRVFDEHHYDGEVRAGKRSGAFCSTLAPDLTPWILHSFQGRTDDVTTMAHELGHAMHSMLAEHHNALTQHSSLPLAETASTFAEMLVVDRMLARDPSPDLERDLLFSQVDDAYATIMRQAWFAIFEKEAHERIIQGASVDDISALYLRLLKEQFGDSVDLSDDFQVEWVEIPHIYSTPFYVYAYAFGQLLVLSLYQQYLKEGESFKPRYKAILAAGGSASPREILEAAGIDMSSAAFWQGGFDVVAGMLERLEQMQQAVA